MTDRKYRQRGYQDDDRRPAQSDRTGPRETRVPDAPGFRRVFRCARCGAPADPAVAPDGACGRCAADLHSCAQCASFDPGAPFECAQPIPARISPKDARNDCRWFEPRVTIERDTGSAGPTDARRAFDDLFKQP